MMNATISRLADKLYDQQPLSQAESHTLFDAIINGEVEPIVLSAVLTALKIKGETPCRNCGRSESISQKCQPFPTP